MRKWKTTLPVVLSAVAAIIMFAQPDKASAAPVQEPARISSYAVDRAPAGLALTVPGTSDVQPLATYYLNRTDTLVLWTIWTAGGAGGLAAACGRFVYPILIAECVVAVAILVTLFIAYGRPNGRCLAFTTKLGWPPLSVRYITCP